MALQRRHTRAAQLRRRDEHLDAEGALAAARAEETPTWRPFQLAFVLLNLPGLSDPLHPERGTPGLADLLWFPTGGGKTEAYLGLTAYTLALRRLQTATGQERLGGYDASEGVAVIMRYTLRLLTIQQFQRANALICACEALRREAAARGDSRWGATPFRIGLWVGMRATPNTTEDAERWVKQRRKTARWTGGAIGSPAQLTVCPWCGADINERADIVIDKDLGRTFLYCGDPTGTCLFTAKRSPQEGLPAVVVDEELYRLLLRCSSARLTSSRSFPGADRSRRCSGASLAAASVTAFAPLMTMTPSGTRAGGRTRRRGPCQPGRYVRLISSSRTSST
jgi:hypothetical protein